MAEKVIGLSILIEANTGTEQSPDYTVVAGQRDATLTPASDAIDTSSKDGNGWKTSAVGLKGWDMDLDGVYVDTSTGFTALETAFSAGTDILVRVSFPDGTKRRGAAKVTSMPIKAPMGGESTYSFKLQGNGALTTDTETTTAPTFTAPLDEAINVAVEAAIVTAAFASSGIDTHAATQWQVTEDDDPTFAAPIIDTTTTTDLLSLPVAAGVLEAATDYKARARHKGTIYGWSAWSEVSDFTTAA